MEYVSLMRINAKDKKFKSLFTCITFSKNLSKAYKREGCFRIVSLKLYNHSLISYNRVIDLTFS